MSLLFGTLIMLLKMPISTATPAAPMNTYWCPYAIHTNPPTDGMDIETAWLMLIPSDNDGAMCSGFSASFDINTWFGLFGPAGLPAETVQRMNRAFIDAMNQPDVKARLASLMAEASPTTPPQFAAFVKAELAKYEKVVKASGATVD